MMLLAIVGGVCLAGAVLLLVWVGACCRSIPEELDR
jgi:hypothetical protein